MTQVDEKGHEGNTAVVTAYLCGRKHGQGKSRLGVPADYYNILFTLNFISYSYSNHAEYYYLLSTLLYSYSGGSQVKVQPSSGHVVISSTQDRA